MLLDQKKTKRMVKIVSIICAVAFVGVLPVVLGLVIFGNDGAGNGQAQLLDDAEKRVRENPTSLEAIVELANQYRAADRPQDAAVQLQKAIGIGAKNNDELQTLVTGLASDPAQTLSVLQAYTKANPKDADAFFQYGSAAERVGQTLTARLAYQQAAKVAAKGSSIKRLATDAVARLRDAPVPETPALPPPTQTGPATPATP